MVQRAELVFAFRRNEPLVGSCVVWQEEHCTVLAEPYSVSPPPVTVATGVNCAFFVGSCDMLTGWSFCKPNEFAGLPTDTEPVGPVFAVKLGVVTPSWQLMQSSEFMRASVFCSGVAPPISAALFCMLGES